jgi:hypothetical protein
LFRTGFSLRLGRFGLLFSLILLARNPFGVLRRNQRFHTLLRQTICIATLTTVIALTPAYSAAPKECTDAHMKQMDAMIAKMTDAAKQKEATTALDMSKAEMKKGNKEGCMKYMKEAHTAMGLH